MRNATPLRPLGSPSPIRVRVDRRGDPVEVHVRGRGRPRKVVSIRESWRIDDEWWRCPVSRLYHQAVLEQGEILTLYRDLIDGRWYVQKVGPPTAPNG